MPHPNHVNPLTGIRYGFEAEQRAKKGGANDRAIEQEIALLERQKVAKEAAEDLLKFSEFMSPDPEEPNNVHKSRYKAAPFHRIIAKHLEEVERGDIKQLIFCMPPRHGKTQLATKNFGAWYSGRHPDHNVAIGSYSDTMAEDMGADIRAIFASKNFQQVFPNHKLRRGGNAKANIQTDKGARIVAVGRGGALTGRGAHCLVGETVLETLNGSKPLKEILVGERVLSYHKDTGELVWRRVEAVVRHPRARVYRVSDHTGRTVEATSDHRFYTEAGWKEAAELAAGDRLLCAVRGDVDAAGCGGDEALQTRAGGPLLLEHVLGEGDEPAAARGKDLRALRRPGTESERDVRQSLSGSGVLLCDVLGRGATGGIGAAGAGAHEAVRAMQCDVRATQRGEQVLRHGLQQSGAFVENEGRQQPTLEGRSVRGADEAPRDETLPGTAPDRHQTGRGPVRSMREQGTAGGASYRREPAEQPGHEPRDGLSAVSREGALFTGEAGIVVSVEDTRRDAFVYDIQVEETECFFANGILSHNCLLIDDLFKDHEEARSQTIRDQAWNWFTKVAMTRRMGRKLVLITMTRWHSDDIIGRITDPENPCYNAIEAKKWKIIRLPAMAEEDDPLGRSEGEPLWPDGPDEFDLDFLQSQQRLDPLGFASLYQQRPTVADGILFRRENIQRYDPKDLPENLRYYCTSDHAVGTKQRNDPSCFGKAGVDQQDNLWLVDLFWKRVPTDQAVEAMLAMGGGTNKPILWWAERGHISQSIGPFLNKRMGETGTYINVREVTPVGDKEQRAQSIAARVAMGKVYIPKGPIWDKMVEELLAFPNGVHDDAVDMLSLFGLGLQSQFGMKKAAPKKEEPKFGTLAWVKLHDRWTDERKQAAKAGGF